VNRPTGTAQLIWSLIFLILSAITIFLVIVMETTDFAGDPIPSRLETRYWMAVFAAGAFVAALFLSLAGWIQRAIWFLPARTIDEHELPMPMRTTESQGAEPINAAVPDQVSQS